MKMIYRSYTVAKREQLDSQIAINYRSRILNASSYQFNNCVGSDPEDAFFELPAIVGKMNSKIEAQNKHIKNAVFKEKGGSYDDYLKGLEPAKDRQALIEPFDFCSMRPSRDTAKKFFEYQTNSGLPSESYLSLTKEMKLRFLSQILRFDPQGDTTLAFDTIFDNESAIDPSR